MPSVVPRAPARRRPGSRCGPPRTLSHPLRQRTDQSGACLWQPVGRYEEMLPLQGDQDRQAVRRTPPSAWRRSVCGAASGAPAAVSDSTRQRAQRAPRRSLSRRSGPWRR